MPKTSPRPWLLPTILAVIVVALGLVAVLFRDQLATFVRYTGGSSQGGNSLTVISCLDEEQDGSCDGNLGRIGVTLQLELPDGTILSGSTDNAGGQMTFNDLAAGGYTLTSLLNFPGRITSANPDTFVVQRATTRFVAVSVTGESSATVVKSVINPISQNPTTESDSTTAVPGQQLTFNLDLNLNPANRGDVTTETVQVIDDFDQNCVEEIVSMRPVARTNGNTLTWNLTNVKGNYERRLSYTVRLKSQFTGGLPTCINKVSVIDSGATIGNAQASVTVVQPPAGSLPDLSIRMLDSNGSALQLGDQVQYTMEIRNLGTQAGVMEFFEDIPLKLENPLVTQSPQGSQVTIARTGGANGQGTVTVSGVNVAAGGSETIVITFTVVRDAQKFDLIETIGEVTDVLLNRVETHQRAKVGQVSTILQAE